MNPELRIWLNHRTKCLHCKLFLRRHLAKLDTPFARKAKGVCSLANPDSHKYELTYCNLLFGSLPPTMRVIVLGTRTFTSKVNSIPPYPRAHLNVFTGNQGYWALFRVEIIRAKGVGLVLLFLVLAPTHCMQHRHLCHPIGHCCVLLLPGSRWGIKTRLKLAVHIQISNHLAYFITSSLLRQFNPASSTFCNIYDPAITLPNHGEYSAQRRRN